MKIFNHQKRREDGLTLPNLPNLINTWLQPGANSNETVFRVCCDGHWAKAQC
jgi:hypothetical protein